MRFLCKFIFVQRKNFILSVPILLLFADALSATAGLSGQLVLSKTGDLLSGNKKIEKFHSYTFNQKKRINSQTGHFPLSWGKSAKKREENDNAGFVLTRYPLFSREVKDTGIKSSLLLKEFNTLAKKEKIPSEIATKLSEIFIHGRKKGVILYQGVDRVSYQYGLSEGKYLYMLYSRDSSSASEKKFQDAVLVEVQYQSFALAWTLFASGFLIFFFLVLFVFSSHLKSNRKKIS